MRSLRRKRKLGFQKIIIDGIPIYSMNIPLGRLPRKIQSGIASKALISAYKSVVNDFGRVDIVHAHFSGIGYTSIILKEKYNIPLIITEHSSALMGKKINSNLIKLGNQTYHKANKMVVVSHSLQEILSNEFNIKSVYIPNIVDFESFKYKISKNNNRFTFISVGNLIYRKRMDLVVDAFIRTFKFNNNVYLIIVGEGEERKRIEEIIHKNNFEDRIALTGRLPRYKIGEYMAESKCFVLPSQAETFGVVYAEAMGAGLPVIATKCGGPESFVNQENGKLIDIDDIDGLCEAMQDIYFNYSTYSRHKISEFAKSQFSPQKIASKLVDLYKEVLND